jgi:iron complex transport system substrate-binding protein
MVLLGVDMALFSQSTVEQKPLGKTYTDSLKNVIALDDIPTRIISLAPNVTETIAALGSRDSLVGRTDYCNFPLGIETLPSIGTLYNPSVEKLISLKPDLVIASSFVSDQLIASLQKASIKVICIDKQETFEGTYDLIADIALILGKENQGAELIESMKAKVSKVIAATQEIAKPKVYFMVDFGSFDGTATGDTFISEMLSLCGAINIAQDASKWTYSKELLVRQDPDIIVMTARWGETPEETKTLFSSTKPYSDLRATKAGALVTVDADLISRQGPRSADALMLLAKAIHPEVAF